MGSTPRLSLKIMIKTMIQKINIKFGIEIKWNQTMRGELKKTIKKINETERNYNENNWDNFLYKKKGMKIKKKIN